MSYLKSVFVLGLLASLSNVAGGAVLERAAALGPSAVNLGTAGNFVILAKTGVSSVPASAVIGNIGLSPAAASFITGFSLILSPLGTFSSSSQVAGQIKAANYAVPTPSQLTTAIGDMGTAFTDAAGRPNPNFLNIGTGNLGGLTLAPGLYKFSTGVNIPTSVTISGSSTDTWIFQVSGTLVQAASTRVNLAGGALPRNIVWVVTGAVTIGGSATFQGIILAKTSVTLVTSSVLNGRILSQTNVALQKATVTVAA
ncbi:antifreeze protein [Crassisporium funariophilum]|nr:antifreeze protein [Crassisporium funariophilum]